MAQAKDRVQNPTVDTMVSTAIERRKAGKPPASLVKDTDEDEERIIGGKKSEPAPLNKMSTQPANKAAKAPAKKKGK